MSRGRVANAAVVLLLITTTVVAAAGVGRAPARAAAPTADLRNSPACREAPSAGFPDVGRDSTHRPGIDCVVWWAVANGHVDGRYRPGVSITRAQMATFVANAVLTAGGELPAPQSRFPDAVGTHERAIERLAAAGIVDGFQDGSYGPARPVTRGQMARFLANAAAHVRGRPLPAGTNPFPDARATVHAADIARVAAAGIALGDTEGRYHPDHPVTRDQLGTFVARLLDLWVGEGVAVRAAASAVDRAAIDAEVCPTAADDVARADRLLAGRYRWAPHPEVTLGTNLTWREDPFDPNWRFQLHALRWLWPLLSAYEETGEVRYRDHAVRMAQDWAVSNPVVGPAAPMAWDDHAAAWRALVLSCLSLTLDTTPTWLSDSLVLHRTMLANPSFYVGNKGNHALNQDVGMLAIACLSEAWQTRDLATERIDRLVRRGVDDDGVMDEQAVEYQAYNYERYLAAARMIDACGRSLGVLDERIAPMPAVLAHMTLPNGTYATLGDSDRRPATPFAHPAMQWVSSQGTTGAPPDETFVVYDAGFAFARSGWGVARPMADETMLTARFGPRPFLHGQDDHGSLTLYAGGQPLLADPGKYAYVNDAMRAHVRSREAHSLVTVGAPGCEVPDQPSRISGVRSDATADRFRLSVRTCRGTTWERSVAYLPDGGEVVVVDDVTAPSGTPVHQRWQLEVGAEVTGTAQRLRASWPSGASLLIEQLAPVTEVTSVAGSRTPHRGWISTSYGSVTAAPNLAYTAPTRAQGRTTRFVTVLRPGADGASPASTVTGADGVVRVTVPTAGGQDVTLDLP